MFDRLFQFFRHSEPAPAPTPGPEVNTAQPAETATPPDPVQPRLAALPQQGYDTALTTGVLTPDQARITVAEEDIIALFGNLHRGDIDPAKSQADALLQQEMDSATSELQRLEGAAEHMKKRAAEARAAVPAPEPPPQASPYAIGAGITALGVTFAMSLAELPLLRDIPEAEMKLWASLVIGLAIAGTCIASLYNLAPHDEKASVVRPKSVNDLWHVLAGLSTVCALGLIRMALTGDDLLLTSGLVALDAGLLMYLKGDAAQHRNKIAVHAERTDARIQKEKAADDAQREHNAAVSAKERAKNELNAVKARYQQRLSYAFDLNAATQAGIAAWREGYMKGIDENRSPRGGAASARRAA